MFANLTAQKGVRGLERIRVVRHNVHTPAVRRLGVPIRDCVLARHISSPADLEARDVNLVGGDISGGSMAMRQFLFRPEIRSYSTGAPNLYICSASTPPGGGVHGMCGFHAAKLALFRASH